MNEMDNVNALVGMSFEEKLKDASEKFNAWYKMYMEVWNSSNGIQKSVDGLEEAFREYFEKDNK